MAMSSQSIAEHSYKWTTQFIDGLPVGIVVFDAQLRVQYWNKELSNLSGIHVTEVAERSISDVFTFLQAMDLIHKLEEVFEGKISQVTGFYPFHKQGVKNYYTIRFLPLKNSVGITAGVMEVTPTTKEYMQEHVSKEKEDRFRIMADCAPVMLWMAGKDSECHFFNKGWLEFTGRSMAEEIGVGWASRVHPVDLQVMLNTYMAAFSKHVSFMMEYRLLRHDGEYCWILDHGAPYFDDARNFCGFIGSCIDITPRKLNEEKLQKTTDALLSSNAELEQMTRLASHDLQEPLRTIVSYSQLLMSDYEEKIDAEAEQLLNKIVSASERMKILIQGMLSYSQVTETSAQFIEVDLNLVLEEALRDLQESLQTAHVEITVAELPTVKGIRLQLYQLFLNLLSNSIKYRNVDSSKINIKVELKEQQYIITVSDNGVGFDMRYAEKIFGMFKRLWSRDEYAGEGIGLAICKKIVEAHGGKIWATSSIGIGSAFSFSLPRGTT
jgi:PAS domain S-box-containing protein